MQFVWFGTPPLALTASAIFLSFVLGALSYRFIERPVRCRRLLATRKQLAAACLVALGLAAALGAAGHFRIVEPHGAELRDRLGAIYAGSPVEQRYVPRTDRLPFILYGDSHARQYYPALSARLGTGALVSDSACLSLPGLTNWQPSHLEYAHCTRLLADLIAVIRKRPTRTVIWAERWDKELVDEASGQVLGRVAGTGGKAFTTALEKAVRALPEGSHIVLVGNVPTAWAAGPEMWKGYLRCHTYWNITCPTTILERRAEVRAINRLLAKFAQTHRNVTFVDPQASLCNAAGPCPILVHGRLRYSDGSHLTPAGADLVARQIAAAVRSGSTQAP